MSQSVKKVELILHNLRSSHNVGAIFRIADCVGVSKIYLTGYTPAPVDQFARPNKEIAKTALGADKNIKWEKVEDVLSLIEKLKTENYYVLALEQAKSAIDYKNVEIRNLTAVILGNEVAGLSPEILGSCSAVAEIPLRGQKESLNVAIASAVALFRWLD